MKVRSNSQMTDEVSVNTTLDGLLVLVLPLDAVLDGCSALHGGHVTQNDTRAHRRLNDLSSHCKPKRDIHFQSFNPNFQLLIHSPSKYINMHVIRLLLIRLTLSFSSSTRSGEEFGRKWPKLLKLPIDGVGYQNPNSSNVDKNVPRTDK